jgi:hypothetical protein
MAKGNIKVEKTSYGCVIAAGDLSSFEAIAVDLEDIPQLIKDLQALLPEPEMDYNTVLYSHERELRHTYSPYCPRGCSGQMENCYYQVDKEDESLKS